MARKSFKNLILSLYFSECIQPSSDPETTFTSPNYPNDYPNGLNELWTLSVNAGQSLILQFDHFDVEESEYSYYSYSYAYDSSYCTYDAVIVSIDSALEYVVIFQ